MYYAQIDQTGICFAVSQLSREVTANNMIAINSYDTTLLGKRWNGTNWEEVPQPDPGPPPETTEQKLARLEEQNLILMDALATTFEEVMALRAIVEGGTAE
jgi:hypothetical protein